MQYASKVAMCRDLIPKLAYDNNNLEFLTNVPVDPNLNAPKQIRWMASHPGSGKLLVAQAACSVRNSDLSFFSKTSMLGRAGTALDSDPTYVFYGLTNYIYRSTLGGFLSGTIDGGDPACAINSVRMIDASGDTDYLYVTSNNTTDGHGVRKVRKSDMTEVANLLATGAGDGQFNNPLGIKYYGGFVYVADFTNHRVVKLDASDLSFVANYEVTHTIYDLDTDGTFWYYAVSAGEIRKRDIVFTSPSIITASVVAYSICIIPDQGDGNGATLAITDSTNSHLARYKCSDLSQVGSDVGSAGDGSSSLFDTVVTGCAGVWTFDDGSTYAVASGANISHNGFSGKFFATAGPHRGVFRAAGGLGAITAIDSNTDALISITNLVKTKPTSLILNTNPALVGMFAALPNRPLLQTFRLNGTLYTVSGGMDDMVATRDGRLSDLSLSQAVVDDIINSIYSARANFTYASSPSLTIAGTDAAPSGNYTDPLVTPGDGNSNSDWSWNGTYHVPLTPKAKIYYLVVGPDHGTDTFYTWSITFTS